MKAGKSRSTFSIFALMGIDLLCKCCQVDQREPAMVGLMLTQVAAEPPRQCVCIRGSVPDIANMCFATIVEAESDGCCGNVCPLGTFPATNSLAELRILLNQCC